MLLTLLYDLCLIIIALLALPKLLYLWIVRKKYRGSFLQRLGINFPSFKKKSDQIVWIHAVSVGEARAVAPLAKMMKAAWPEAQILVSSVTETGHAEAKRSLPFADAHVYMPFDFRWIIAPIVKQINPSLVILCESDFWLNFLRCVHAQGGKSILVNGKLSETSMRRFASLPFFTRPLFSLLDILCVQNKHYAERFVHISIPEEKIHITGNMKFDDHYPKLSSEEMQSWRQELGLKPEDQVLVVGSSHDPEEKLILNALDILWKDFPHLKLILVPRHPERFTEVAALLQKQQIPFQHYSELGSAKSSARVILMDAMGLLRKCYQVATLALVAGSYTPKVGGHNIMEPSWYGVPVLFGPYMHSQPELVELVHEYHSGLQVAPEALTQTLKELLESPKKCKALGEAGMQLVGEMHGATLKTWAEINKLKIFPDCP